MRLTHSFNKVEKVCFERATIGRASGVSGVKNHSAKPTKKRTSSVVHL